MELSMIPLSVVIITLNAEPVLDPCLASVSFAHEILIVDAGSTDKTLEIAHRHGARVVHQPWLGFGKQKHLAVTLATHDWVLCLDSDERVSEDLKRLIDQTLLAPDCMAYRFPRCNRFMGRWLRHGEGYPDYQLRLFHRNHAQWREDPIHEGVETRNAVGTLSGDLLHESAQTLEQYLAKQNRYTTLQAQILFEKGKNPGVWQMVFSPIVRFVKFYCLRLGFLDGVPGLIHISLGCINSFVKYAKVREIDINTKQSLTNDLPSLPP
ncbi:MAG: glycosyltransferase family 2 protein [Magnetococcus sp. YQC-5]